MGRRSRTQTRRGWPRCPRASRPSSASPSPAAWTAPGGGGRFTPQDSRERLGRAVEGPLVDHLAGKRATEAALQVAAGIPGPRLRTPALALLCDPRDGMRAQAATPLAALGAGAGGPG